jgi:hypothetical protein
MRALPFFLFNLVVQSNPSNASRMNSVGVVVVVVTMEGEVFL